MAKFPSQRKLHYKLEGIDDQTMTALGHINLPKDLSIVNRRGYASTTNKGVPLVFRCKVDFYLQNAVGHLFDNDGTALASAYDADMQATLKFTGAQNNWVMRNAAVKWHAAREQMWRAANIKKSMLGAYSGAIRYVYDAHDDTWLDPVDGDGNAFVGGTWDVTTLVSEDDADFKLKLVGVSVDEDSSTSVNAYQIGHTYLASRSTVPDDSNLESSELPADDSVLQKLLRAGEGYSGKHDDIVDDAQDGQDNPPYDIVTSDDTNHDITESVELGRCVAGMGSAFGSMIVDIPFGFADCRGTIMQHATQTDEPDGYMAVEVLDIFEMQG